MDVQSVGLVDLGANKSVDWKTLIFDYKVAFLYSLRSWAMAKQRLFRGAFSNNDCTATRTATKEAHRTPHTTHSTAAAMVPSRGRPEDRALQPSTLVSGEYSVPRSGECARG